MAFSRKQMVAAVAGTLSLAVLTGCPAAPTGTNPPASTAPSAAASAAASVAPTAAPSAAASVTPTAAPSAATSAAPGVSPVPTSSAPAPSGKVVIVSGNVYDEEGATIDGALITVKSLDASVPYTATATSQAGSWVVNNVPEGANVEIISTKDGFTTRRRVGSFQQQATGKKNVINFGAAGGNAETDSDDPTGEAYFISDMPEISMTSPADEATQIDGSKTSYKVTFSEALTEDSRDDFVDAFNIAPADSDSAKGAATGALDLESFESGATTSTGDGLGASMATGALTYFNGGYGYNLGEGDAFLGSTRNKMTASWNAEGTEVTFSFNGNLISSDNDNAKYQVFLVAQDSNDAIEDADGNQLGTSSAGSRTANPTAGGLIFNAFKENDLATATPAGDVGDSNWDSTHTTVVNFELREDNTDPKLTGIDITKEDDDVRVELTFSEPMAAFNGTSQGFFDASATDLDNYVFMVGQDRGDLNNVDVKDEDSVDKGASMMAATNVSTLVGYEKEFDFGDLTATLADIDTLDGSTTGIVAFEVDGDNPNTIFLWLNNQQNFFDTAKEIKARVGDVADPAGNTISDSDADKNIVQATI